MPHVIVGSGAGPAGASLAFGALRTAASKATLLERQRATSPWSSAARRCSRRGSRRSSSSGLGAALAGVPRARLDSLELYLNRSACCSASRGEADLALFGGRLPAPLSQPALLEAIVAAAATRP